MKDKIDKFNCVTLYDPENKVLRPMGKSFRREDFSDEMELLIWSHRYQGRRIRNAWRPRLDQCGRMKKRNDKLKAKKLDSAQKIKALILELQDTKDCIEDPKQKLCVSETTLAQ